MRPTATFLIGPAGAGKTVYRATLNAVAISTDDLIEQWASVHGVTYTEAFRQVDLRAIERQMMITFETAMLAEQDIVIDRTNMSRKTRAKFLTRLPASYRRIAVVFTVPREVLNRRLDERAARTGKCIAAEVVDAMLARYQPPGEDEFDTIVQVK